MARHAILIGNSQFPADATHLRTLRCPENDVRGLTSLLGSEQHGSYVVKSFVDATHDIARRGIYQALKKAASGDLVLIYYSGHGKLDQDGNLYLATKDTNTDELPPTSIPVEDIRKYARESSAASIVIVLDCCFSGAVGKIFKGEVSDQASQAIKQLEGEGTFFLTASTDIQLAEEKEGDEYSLLTKYLVSGIQEGTADLNDDGIVGFQELCSFVQGNIAKYGGQKPKAWCIDSAGEVAIALTGKPAAASRRKAITKKLYELAAQDYLSSQILAEVLPILSQPERDKEGRELAARAWIDSLYAKLNNNADFIQEVFRRRGLPHSPPPAPLETELQPTRSTQEVDTTATIPQAKQPLKARSWIGRVFLASVIPGIVNVIGIFVVYDPLVHGLNPMNQRLGYLAFAFGTPVMIAITAALFSRVDWCWKALFRAAVILGFCCCILIISLAPVVDPRLSGPRGVADTSGAVSFLVGPVVSLLLLLLQQKKNTGGIFNRLRGVLGGRSLKS